MCLTLEYKTLYTEVFHAFPHNIYLQHFPLSSYCNIHIQDLREYRSHPYAQFHLLRLWLPTVNISPKILHGKIPEISPLNTVQGNVTKSHAIPLCPAWDVNHPVV